MKKNDKEKLDNLIEKNCQAYKYCFTEESSYKYLVHFSEVRSESARYNGDFNRLRLDCLKDKDGDYIDISDEISVETLPIVNEVKSYFEKGFRKCMKEILPIYFEELKKQRKAEKDAEKEAKKGK